MSFRRQLLARKSLDTILAEMEGGENRLKRALGPVNLTALGIGAVIGAGIFVTTGEAANPQAPFAITRTPKPKLDSSETDGVSRVLPPPRSGDMRSEMS